MKTATRQTRSNLRILHINVNSIIPKIHEFNLLLKSTSPDVITLNETKLSVKTKFYVEDFNCYRIDKSRKAGGIAILVKKNIDSNRVHLPTQYTDTLLIQLSLPNQYPIHIATTYVTPSEVLSSSLLKHLSTIQNLVIAADVNAHHVTLGSATNNASGKKLAKVLNTHGLLHHPTPPTRMPMNRRQGPTTPDKLLTTLDLIDHVSSIMIGDDIGSDHVPLLFNLKTKPWSSKDVTLREHTYDDYANVDWVGFRNDIEDALPEDVGELTSAESIDQLNDRITDTLTAAKASHIPTKTISLSNKPLPARIITLIKAKRKVHRLYNRLCRPDHLRRLYRSLHEQVRAAVTQHREDELKKVCLDMERDKRSEPATFWKAVKRLQGNSHGSRTPTLIANGKAYTSDEDVARIHRDSLETIYQVPSHPDFDSEFFDDVNNEVDSHHEFFNPLLSPPEFDPDNPLTANITPCEIEDVCKRLKNTAPGPDGISNRMLKKMPSKLVNLLCVLFTWSMALGYVPRRWKHAYVLLFLKPGKDPSDPNNYRPISLTCTLSKLLEKILSRRIHVFLNKNHLLPDTQAGFRPGVNIYDQVLRVATALQNYNNNHSTTLVAFMDVQKAFDSVWHNGLRIKLQDLGLPDIITRWLSDFLRGRTAQVRTNGHLSESFDLHAGVPQGSAISPLLYLLFVHDLPNPSKAGVPYTGLAQFADDTAFWVASRRPSCVANRMNTALANYVKYCNQWRITLNRSKTQLLYCNPKRRARDKFSTNPILLGSTRLTPQDTATYLGIVFDHKLTFHHHITAMKKKARTRINLIHRLSRHCSEHTLNTIYKAMIRPVLTWGHPLHATIAAEHLDKLAATERVVLRKASKLLRGHSNIDLYRVNDTPPLSSFVDHLNDRYTARMLKSSFCAQLVADLGTLADTRCKLTTKTLICDNKRRSEES